MKILKPKEPLVILGAAALTVVCFIILRAVFPPLTYVCGFIEENWQWGRSAVIGLQSGLAAAAGTTAYRLFQNRKLPSNNSKL